MSEEQGIHGFLYIFAFSFGLAAVERLHEQQIAECIVSILIAIAFYLLTQPAIRARVSGRTQIGISAALVFGFAGFVYWEAGTLRIVYQDVALNGQTVTLVRPADPTKPVTRMIVEPNFPDAFTITGLGVRNDTNAHTLIDVVRISFDQPIKKFQANDASWRPVAEEDAVSGWTTYETFLTPGVDPGHSRGFWDFRGTPIPSKPVRVKIAVVYGRRHETAEFILKPPSQ